LQLGFWKHPPPAAPEAEPLIEALYASLSEAQRREICLPWDCADERRGLVRGFIANHWQVTPPCVRGDFFNPTQQAVIFEIFQHLLTAKWQPRFLQALKDDTKGHNWGQDQSIAFLGTPGNGPWQFVFSGRHLTLRAQSPGASDFAFGGPVVYGHAVQGSFQEHPQHPGNVFWPQAIAASQVHALLDERIRHEAEVDELPREYEIGFRATPQGAKVAAFPRPAKSAFNDLLQFLMEPYCTAERERIRVCIAAQGGIESLSLAFARAPRMSAPLWDVWRIEGPAFVWHFQGFPHVHGWVHIANSPRAGAIRARHGSFLFPGQDELR
jgi:hypothetical protein